MTNNLSRIAIIARHEFLAIAGKKSFIVMTILVPLISLACIGLPYVMMQFNKGDVETVAVVDESGRYGKAITDNDEFRFHDITPIASDGGGELHEFYQQQDGLYAIVIIPADVDSSLTVDIFSENAVRMGLQRHVAQCLGDTITQSRIASYHIPQLDKIIADSHVEVSPNCVKWSDDGEESRSDAELASVIGLILAFLTYMFVMMYGAMILTSVVEEKANRIIEVMVSCCKPIELLLGKIIGVGFVGIAQIAIWCVFLGLISAIFGIGSVVSNPDLLAQQAQIASTLDTDTADIVGTISQSLASINLAGIAICFVLYFIGGYLLYGSMFAAAGSTVDQPNEGSQATVPMMMFLVLALWAGIACMDNPDGGLAWWCSMIPFTSPVVMMVRLPYDVPLWEIALSIAILLGSALGIAFVAAKIYRKGILLYGKKFSWKNIAAWLK